MDNLQKRGYKIVGESGCHTWIVKNDGKYPFCLHCNLMKRADGKNKPCKGKVKVKLR
jgi:hypothetical protein